MKPLVQRRGNLCSNFPIGLFGCTWLPGHPTFGINLNYLKSGEKRCVGDRIGKVPMEKVPGPDSDHASESWQDDVYLPPVTDHLRPQWTSITEMFSFLGAIFNSAQNYHDTLQSMLPSYSERIVQVWLDPDEGGMNLAMDANKIRSLIDKGELAGSKLAGMDFDAHRCMRLQVLLKVLCVEIEDLHARYPTLAEYEAIAKAPGTRCSEPDQTFWADVKPYVDSLAMFAAMVNGKALQRPLPKIPSQFEGNPPHSSKGVTRPVLRDRAEQCPINGEIARSAQVWLSIARGNSAGRTRTYNQPVNSRLLYH